MHSQDQRATCAMTSSSTKHSVHKQHGLSAPEEIFSWGKLPWKMHCENAGGLVKKKNQTSFPLRCTPAEDSRSHINRKPISFLPARPRNKPDTASSWSNLFKHAPDGMFSVPKETQGRRKKKKTYAHLLNVTMHTYTHPQCSHFKSDGSERKHLPGCCQLPVQSLKRNTV